MSVFSRREWLKTTGTGCLAYLTVSLWGGEETLQGEDPEMIVIPAGKFLMGTPEKEAERLARTYGYHPSWLSGEVPPREIELPAYAIDKFPVTNRQFAAFCAATGYPPRPHWPGGKPPEPLLDHPVVCVNRADALAYARWAGKRLPTEAEWEKAARGPDGRRFPWGDEFDPEACQWNRDRSPSGAGTAPVTAHPRGISPYGVWDLVGNVAEWCADGPSPAVAFIKGGCWLTEEVLNLRPAARNMSGFDSNASNFYGFRCAKEGV